MTPETRTDSTEQKTEQVTSALLDSWATKPDGPVALHMTQTLLPVEQIDNEGISVIFPPTYADIGYNIDSLSDGTRVVTIDSVGSQANRMEPVFRVASKEMSEWLVPQILIELAEEDCGECEACKSGEKGQKCTHPHKEMRSLLDLAHRSADAVVQSSPELSSKMGHAFVALRRTGNAKPLCELAPTSLVFGVWDSRGGTGEKRPRLVRSLIRAWDVDMLHGAAQFNSISKSLTEEQQKELESEAKAKKVKLSAKGLADAPAVFRKVSQRAERYLPEFRDGGANPDRRVLGGVCVRGRIERQVTVNLVALRGIRGEDDRSTDAIRKYLLGLSLFAATAEIDLFLREGCHLRYTEQEDVWHKIPRRGAPGKVALSRELVERYAETAAGPFREIWEREFKDGLKPFKFNLKEAKKLLAKKDEEEGAAG